MRGCSPSSPNPQNRPTRSSIRRSEIEMAPCVVETANISMDLRSCFRARLSAKIHLSPESRRFNLALRCRDPPNTFVSRQVVVVLFGVPHIVDLVQCVMREVQIDIHSSSTGVGLFEIG